jgi:glycosyltransferase involved in cell wall biosynthesis
MQPIGIINQNKLSVCIPTFNRARLLAECLESFSQYAKTHDVELLVADNRSDDETLEILQSLSHTIPSLRYEISEKREPLWDGITRAVLMASSEFCWLFSDDDRISGDGIGRVLSALGTGVQVVVVNAATMSKNFSHTIEDRRLPIREDILYQPGKHEDFLIDTAFYLSFLGGVVVHRETFLRNQSQMLQETYFRHVSSILAYCPKVPVYVIAEPFVQIRLQNSVWSSKRFEVLMVNWPSCIWGLSNDYSKSCKSSVVHECRLSSLSDMLAARAFGMLSYEVFCDYIQGAKLISKFNKFVIRTISKTPRFPLKWALYGYLFFFRPRGFRLYLYELTKS